MECETALTSQYGTLFFHLSFCLDITLKTMTKEHGIGGLHLDIFKDKELDRLCQLLCWQSPFMSDMVLQGRTNKVPFIKNTTYSASNIVSHSVHAQHFPVTRRSRSDHTSYLSPIARMGQRWRKIGHVEKCQIIYMTDLEKSEFLHMQTNFRFLHMTDANFGLAVFC